MPDPLSTQSADAMRDETKADVSINQIPDDGVIYEQYVKAPANARARNNRTSQPQPDRAE